ncbi:hypothetical protein MIMGU_mgv11b0221162mg, partial [Erythranthe guttata]
VELIEKLNLKLKSGIEELRRITLSCLCPCCLCVTVIVELALGLIKAPFHVMRWFTKQIPC